MLRNKQLLTKNSPSLSYALTKPKMSKRFNSFSFNPKEFLPNDKERNLFLQQRLIIYALNELMRKAELANYDAFLATKLKGELDKEAND